MRRLILVLVASCFIFITVLSSSPDARAYETGFESSEGYILGPIDNQQGWTVANIYGDPSDTIVISDTKSYSGSNSVKFSDWGGDIVSSPKDKVFNGLTALEFHLWPGYRTNSNYALYSSLLSSTGTDIGIILAKDNVIRFYSGTWRELASYTPGDWYKIQCLLDVPNNQLDFYINDVKANVFPIPFRFPAENFNYAFFYAMKGKGEITEYSYLDDFRVYAIPEPHSIIFLAMGFVGIYSRWQKTQRRKINQTR